MPINVTDTHGRPIVHYRGTCDVTYTEDETTFNAHGYFEAAQFASGRIAIGVIPTDQATPTRINLATETNAAVSFTGRALTSWTIKATGETFFSRIPWLLLPLAASQPRELTMAAQYLEASRPGAKKDGYRHAHFLVSNMLWHHRAIEEPETIELNLRGYHLSVNAVNDYSEVAHRLTHAHGVAPTAWIHVESPPGLNKTLHDFQDVIDDLMYIFRLVTGNYVDWYYGETRTPPDARPVERVHKFSTPTNYSNTLRFEHLRTGHTSLVPKLNLANLATAFFDDSVHKLKTSQLKTLVNQFTTACSDAPFFESSGLLASTLTELIVSKRSQATDTSNIISRAKYKSHVIPALDQAVRSLDLLKDKQDAILAHVMGGYRRSFRQKLQALRDELDLPLTDCHISLIVATRNALVHRGTFQSKAEDGGWHHDYNVLIWTNLIALYRLLGYRGDLPEQPRGQSIIV